MMKNAFSIIFVAAMAFCGVCISGCSKDSDDSKPESEPQLEVSEWKNNIIGSWAYDSGKKTKSKIETFGSKTKTGTETFQEWQDMTINAASGSYSRKYDSKTEWDDGSKEDNSYNYTIKFTYEFVSEEYEFASSAHLACNITESDNSKFWKVGEKFYISIFSMTKNSVVMCSGNDSHVNRVTLLRK